MSKPKGTRVKYTSKGVHSNVSRKTRNSIRRDYMASGDRLVNQQRALHAGKDIVVRTENPNAEADGIPFLRERVSGRTFLASRHRYSQRSNG